MHDLRDETVRTPALLSKEALPLFSLFFLWSFGTGALLLGRPLFAFALVDSYAAVGAVLALGLVPQLTTPLMGALVDRLGRRQVVVAGAALHGGVSAIQVFADSYLVFAVLEFISGFGAAAWLVGSTTMLADFTRVTNRGRGVALRKVTMSLGLAMGPALGGVVAAAFDLSAVFIVGAVTRVPIVVLTWLLVRETRPAPAFASGAEGSLQRRPRLDLSLFMTRHFLALSVVTLAVGLAAASQNVFQTDLLVPSEDAALGLAVLGLITTLMVLPVGAAVDWWGRKVVLLTGLATLAGAMFLAPWSNVVLMVVLVLGMVGIGKRDNRDRAGNACDGPGTQG